MEGWSQNVLRNPLALFLGSHVPGDGFLVVERVEESVSKGQAGIEGKRCALGS